jgi:hypothetical protein
VTVGLQTQILHAIGDIGLRRSLPDLSSDLKQHAKPTPYGGWSAGALIQAWKDWWNEHKGTRISIAPYEGVSDPYLRCLARKVDWGFEGAILAIADRGGDDAKSVLEKFPNSSNWGIPSIPGNLSEALAKLGDREKWQEILDERGGH